ncbi:hypothetical protein XENOCAPTIV_002334 [Xenoophorus captivus]|uniref:Uncharacterized protein n=1 Tax=Xenoophorus captivus TaxID=1517983 RepID=A0ABV0RN78_9TELE
MRRCDNSGVKEVGSCGDGKIKVSTTPSGVHRFYSKTPAVADRLELASQRQQHASSSFLVHCGTSPAVSSRELRCSPCFSSTSQRESVYSYLVEGSSESEPQTSD